MLGPGLWFALIVVGSVLLVVAKSRREAMAERADAQGDPPQRDGHSDEADDLDPHTVGIGVNGVDPHRGWTGG